MNRNRGRRSIADGGAIPNAGNQLIKDAIVPMRFHVGTIELTDGVIEASKSNEGAFVSAIELETKGVATDMRKDINRQAFGVGTGALCEPASATAGVKKTSKAFKLEFNTEFDVQYIQVGDTIDVLKEATGETGNGVVGAEVTSRSVANKEVTLSKELAGELAAETYNVYISGNRLNEMDGMRNITENERTLHSINSATAGNSTWKGNTVKAGTGFATTAVAGESLFEQLADAVGSQGNGDVEVFLGSRGVRRRLADQYSSQKRWNDAKAVDVHGGYSAVMVNEVPVVADDDCPKTYAFGFNKSALKWFELTKPGWMEQGDGGILHLKPGTTAGTFNAAWMGIFKWYAVLGCVAPNRTGRLEFCADDAPNQ